MKNDSLWTFEALPGTNIQTCDLDRAPSVASPWAERGISPKTLLRSRSRSQGDRRRIAQTQKHITTGTDGNHGMVRGMDKGEESWAEEGYYSMGKDTKCYKKRNTNEQ